jgi:hypothetical protein
MMENNKQGTLIIVRHPAVAPLGFQMVSTNHGDIMENPPSTTGS